jgi:hypothetical protein
MKKFTTINNIEMIQCGDYNWRILKNNDDDETYQLIVSGELNKNSHDVILIYDIIKGVCYVGSSVSTYSDKNFICFKFKFEETPFLVKSIIEGENGFLQPIFHKDNVKIKAIINK